jgi:nucleoside-diphosphate-sugar epimerase
MKVILTGATGTIGSGVLKQCLANPEVQSVIALTRRPLDVKDTKIENIIHRDFLNYDSETREKLKGADACIWYAEYVPPVDLVLTNFKGAWISHFWQDCALRLHQGRHQDVTRVRGARKAQQAFSICLYIWWSGTSSRKQLAFLPWQCS